MSEQAWYVTLEWQKPIRLPNGEETEGRWLRVARQFETVNLLPGAPLWVGGVVPVSSLRRPAPDAAGPTTDEQEG